MLKTFIVKITPNPNYGPERTYIEQAGKRSVAGYRAAMKYEKENKRTLQKVDTLIIKVTRENAIRLQK